MKRNIHLLPVLILAFMIIFISTACFFSVKVFPKIGETGWVFVIADGSTEIASGTFTVDKRTDFLGIKGKIDFLSENATNISFSGTANQDRAIDFSVTITTNPTPTFAFSGNISAADNKIAGFCNYRDQTMQATELYHYTWNATRTK